ncbi:MAG TPA: LysR family transcriptional regulator [Candidatus Xenobia bacterium]|jgi:DNA-binding transcriptional LysR family regulator
MGYDECLWLTMEIIKLRSFLAVAEHGTFSRAGEVLSVTQSTVSLHVQALEEELGVRLFERLPRRTRLTPEGTLLRPSAAAMVAEHDRTLTLFAERKRSGAGVVRIAATNSMTMHFLPERLHQFLLEWPQTEVTILPARRDEMVALLERRECDFALVAAGPLPAGLRYAELLQADIVLITPLKHPLTALGRRKLTLEDVARYKLVVYPDGAIRRAVDHAFQSRDLRYRVAMSTAGADMVKRYVEVGLGIGFVSRLSLRPDDEARLYVISMTRFIPARRYGVVLPRGALSAPARRLLRVLAPDMTP